MTEMLCVGPVEDIDTLIAECQFPPEAMFLTEKFPQHVVKREERQNLLRFRRLDATKQFAEYAAGRIFNQDFELRWEKTGNGVQAIYVGAERKLSELKVMHDLNLETYQTRYYYLFGQRLEPEELEQIGAPAQPGDFAELRIPRLLRYPVSGRRVQLAVREYIEETTGNVMLFRFADLKPVEK